MGCGWWYELYTDVDGDVNVDSTSYHQVRAPFIPESVLAARAAKASGQPISMEKRKTERDLELENGGPGIFSHDHKKLYE